MAKFLLGAILLGCAVGWFFSVLTDLETSYDDSDSDFD